MYLLAATTLLVFSISSTNFVLVRYGSGDTTSYFHTVPIRMVGVITAQCDEEAAPQALIKVSSHNQTSLENCYRGLLFVWYKSKSIELIGSSGGCQYWCFTLSGYIWSKKGLRQYTTHVLYCMDIAHRHVKVSYPDRC